MAGKIINPYLSSLNPFHKKTKRRWNGLLPKVTKLNYCKNTKKGAKCKECGGRFESIRKGHEFCSWECSRSYIKRTSPFIPETISCCQCKVKFQRRTVWQKFCSQHCRDQWGRLPASREGFRICVVCRKKFVPKNSWREKHCSERCTKRRFCEATTKYRRKNESKSLCSNCSNPKLNGISICEIHWFNRVARNSGIVSSNSAAKIKLLLEKQSYTCPYTGKKLTPGVNASLDHIKPRSRFPELVSSISNLEWVDIDVNTAKGVLSKSEFIDMCKLVSSRFK